MVQAKTILSALPHVLKTIDIPELGEKHQGKVRDFYIQKDKRITITTDRQSAFDVVLGYIPYKGAVLNQLAAFWFQKTKNIILNHMISVPDSNVLVSKNCEAIPVEMVVRGYMSGVTKTSIWHSYQKGERMIYGIKFPNGLVKNQKLPQHVITPTTHGPSTRTSSVHDERLTREEILKRKIVPKKLYVQMEEAALELFQYGSNLCEKQGLILVDTKYEFGLYNGEIILIDEVHTPDSSRFWKADTYKSRLNNGEEPENFDKEFLRLWYASRGYHGDGKPPKMSEKLIIELAQRYIAVYEKITGKKFEIFQYPIEKRIFENLKKANIITDNEKITYSQVGDNYDTKDPIKKLAQTAAKNTARNLEKRGFEEITDSRGGSAYVWKLGDIYLASVVEGLGTKNLVADGMREVNGKTYYDVVGHDTVATIINDLITVGANPLVIHAYWAIENNDWLADEARMRDFIQGWKRACDISGVSWGGGETPTLKGIIVKDTVDLGGAAIGIISTKKRLIIDNKLKSGDRILLIKSNGVNANGISLTRAIANKLPNGYATKLSDATYYGEALLTKTNIYAKLTQELLDKNIDMHYISNITGHGLRKIMRARQKYTYVIEKIFDPQEVFLFIQKYANLDDYEMYQTYNMGMDYALFVSEKDAKKAQKIIKKNGFESLDAGFVEKGERQVVIKPKNLVYKGETLDLR